MGNLVHFMIVSGEFWETIGRKISNSMDYKVGTAEGQSEGLQVLGVGQSWFIYLDGMEEYYIPEPLVIQGLSHSGNLGISFLTKHNVKLICTEEEFALMPGKDRSASRAQLVDGGCHSFISQRFRKVLKATKAHRMSTQVWRISCERFCINAVSERPEEAVGVYTQDECSITPGMGKYIPVQTNR